MRCDALKWGWLYTESVGVTKAPRNRAGTVKKVGRGRARHARAHQRDDAAERNSGGRSWSVGRSEESAERRGSKQGEAIIACLLSIHPSIPPAVGHQPLSYSARRVHRRRTVFPLSSTAAMREG